MYSFGRYFSYFITKNKQTKKIETEVSKFLRLFYAFQGGMPALMGSGHTDAEVTNMRRVIAKRLQASKMEVPHYYLTVDVEMDKVMSLRKEINTSYEKEGVKVSVNDFIIKATALACRQVKTDCLKGQIFE